MAGAVRSMVQNEKNLKCPQYGKITTHGNVGELIGNINPLTHQPGFAQIWYKV